MTTDVDPSESTVGTLALSCREAWDRMTEITDGRTIRNAHFDIAMGDPLVETDLFPRAALDVYTAWNLGLDVSELDRATYFSAHRGGSQGDYRAGMREKIANVVDCLTRFPASKRAVISVVPNDITDHTDDGAAKCMRELHFHLDGATLHATVLFRSQAAEIFPKNIHFVGAVMAEVAARVMPTACVGTLHYLATVLVSDRS